RQRPHQAHHGRLARRVPGPVGNRHPAPVRGLAAHPHAYAARVLHLPAPVRRGAPARGGEGVSGALKPPPLDPEIAQALEEFAAHIVTSMTREDIPRVREAGIPPTEAACTMHGYFERRELVIPGAEGAPDIPAVTYLPRATTRPVPVILMLHGGGLVAGRPDSDMPPASELAAATGCGVISVDYRLAPEHPH